MAGDGAIEADESRGGRAASSHPDTTAAGPTIKNTTGTSERSALAHRRKAGAMLIHP